MAEGQISPWMPEQDRVRLAVLGKLIEELNECAARAARCITHGLDEVDPDSGRVNREELEREMADVDACLDVAYEVLPVPRNLDRARRKVSGFFQWHELIRRRQLVPRPARPGNVFEFKGRVYVVKGLLNKKRRPHLRIIECLGKHPLEVD